MEIQVRTKCDSCNGGGVIANPIYDEFNKAEDEYKAKNGSSFSFEQYEQWFKDRGYENPPYEEGTCEDCGGTGWRIQWMRIEDVLISVEK